MTPDMEEVGGTVLSPDAFRKVMKARRDELLQTRLVTEKALRRLDQEIDIYDTFESLMRELAEGPSVAAALAVARFLTADDGAPAPVTKVSGELRLEDEDRFVKGDLVVEGHLLNGGTLVITGNCTVKGNYIERAHGYALLAVGGDLVCDNLLSEYDVVVLGNLRAEGLVYGFYDEHSLQVGETLHAQVLVQEDHETTYRMLQVAHHFPNGVEAEAAAKLFIDKCLEGGIPERGAIATRLSGGKPVLNEGTGERHSLTPRISGLIELMRTAQSYEFIETAGRPSVKIVNQDGSRQISFVTREEQEVMRAVLTP